MITSVRWVPVGAARERPIREDIDAEMAVTEQVNKRNAKESVERQDSQRGDLGVIGCL
jgi:hypothetical protein